jgi:hypothetical protein
LQAKLSLSVKKRGLESIPGFIDGRLGIPCLALVKVEANVVVKGVGKSEDLSISVGLGGGVTTSMASSICSMRVSKGVLWSQGLCMDVWLSISICGVSLP